MRKTTIFIILIVCSISIFAQSNVSETQKDSVKRYSYPIIIADQSLRFSTMKQYNQNFLSGYRYLSHISEKKFGKKYTPVLQTIASLITMPLTHEEGHRSILTSQGIGSISQPIINSKGAAYVNGVSDATLISLRQTNLPTYIRLHTAGLEADYTLLAREEDLILFGQESKNLLFTEYFLRKLSLLFYYSTSPFPRLMPKLKEESDELKRDIVGHDVYGAVKNLYRPEDNFYRYVNHADLTGEEKKFINRVAIKALLNIASPVFFKPLNIVRKDNFKLSVGAGYSMAPFGDFIDENIWIQYQQRYNVKIYLRQYQNRNTWFAASGISLVDYQIKPKLNATLSAHLWNQPKDLDFNTSSGEFGGSIGVLFKYNFLQMKSGNALSLDLGLNYKSKGFLPEEMIMKEQLGIQLGASFHLLSK